MKGARREHSGESRQRAGGKWLKLQQSDSYLSGKGTEIGGKWLKLQQSEREGH